MQRRDFLALTGLTVGGLMVPSYFGKAIAAEQLQSTLDIALKKRLADAALAAAKQAGATYCDVRIGRYLRQFVITREDKVQNVVNTESTGAGIRVIANGAWGFAATNTLTAEGVASAARQAAAIAKANSKTQTAPVQLAKAPGFGEVSWKTPIKKNAMDVPIKDKVDLLLGVNAAAINAGADFVNSMMFLVNEQKYFASTDGSYIDQDVHRIWVPMTVTAIDKASGKFRTRDGLSAPMGLGYEYLDGDAGQKFTSPNGVINYGLSYDMKEDAIAAAKRFDGARGAESSAALSSPLVAKVTDELVVAAEPKRQAEDTQVDLHAIEHTPSVPGPVIADRKVHEADEEFAALLMQP